jgi:TonB family protein
MKTLLLSVLICLLNGAAWAQARQDKLSSSPQQAAKGYNLKTKQTPIHRKVICITESMPTFPGGHDSLVAYLKRNLHYPASSIIEGKVFVEFIITKTGQVTQVKIRRGIAPTLDAEALRVVRQMPRWVQPRRPDPIEVSYTLPITFAKSLPKPTKR